MCTQSTWQIYILFNRYEALDQIIDKMYILSSTAVEFTPAQKISKLRAYR
jgi:hypothetical protein